MNNNRTLTLAHVLPVSSGAIQLLNELGWSAVAMKPETWSQMVVGAMDSFKYDEDAETWVEGLPPRGTLHHRICFGECEQAASFAARMSQRPQLGFKLSALGVLAADDGYEVLVTNTDWVCSSGVTASMARLVWEASTWDGRHELSRIQRPRSEVKDLRIPPPCPPESSTERACRFLTAQENEIWLARHVLGTWVKHWRVQPLYTAGASVAALHPTTDEGARTWLVDCVMSSNAPSLEAVRWMLLQSTALRQAGQTLARTAEFTGQVQLVHITSAPPAELDLGELITIQSATLNSSQKILVQHRTFIAELGRLAPHHKNQDNRSMR